MRLDRFAEFAPQLWLYLPIAINAGHLETAPITAREPGDVEWIRGAMAKLGTLQC